MPTNNSMLITVSESVSLYCLAYRKIARRELKNGLLAGRRPCTQDHPVNLGDVEKPTQDCTLQLEHAQQDASVTYVTLARYQIVLELDQRRIEKEPVPNNDRLHLRCRRAIVVNHGQHGGIGST